MRAYDRQLLKELGEASLESLWRTAYGSISKKPVPVFRLDESNIKVVDSCRTTQPRDDFRESFHATYEAAVLRLIADSERDVARCKKALQSAERCLARAKAKHSNLITP